MNTGTRKKLLIAEPLVCDHPAHADYPRLYELLVAELTDFAVFLTDPTGCIVSWNPGVKRLLGYSEAEWMGQMAHIIFTPEDRAARKLEEEMATASRDGGAPDVRWHLKKNGTRLFVEGTMVALRDSRGELLGFSKVMRDITERKRTEHALRTNEERFRALMHASSDVLYRMSEDWTEMRYLGGGNFLSDTETPSKEWLERYIHPEDQPAVMAAIQQATETKSVFELEHRVRRVDGTLGWTHSRAIPILNASGDITEWFGAATDITERKAAEIERERLLTELARSNDDLSQFAHTASHDLKAPLSTIVQFSQLLLQRYKGKILDESAEEYLNLVITNGRRMSTLTSDLLRFSEAMASPSLLPATSVKASGMVDMATANLQGDIEESGAVITCGALPEVKMDATLLVQLFQNLIANAIKYRSKDVPRIHIAAEELAGSYLFSIKDNGMGIERQHQGHIFEPFKRLHGSEIPGSGIGLTLCKKIVERADGRIWVESNLLQGSTFFFTLPRC